MITSKSISMEKAKEKAYLDADNEPQISFIEFMLESGSILTIDTFKRAVKHENLKLLQWLKSKGCPMGTGSFEEAARIGNVDVLECLRNMKCPWDKSTPMYAAKNNNIHAIVWFKENGFPLLDNACYQD